MFHGITYPYTPTYETGFSRWSVC